MNLTENLATGIKGMSFNIKNRLIFNREGGGCPIKYRNRAVPGEG